MLIKVKCPKCGKEIEVLFHTNQKNGSQNESHEIYCSDCSSNFVAELKEVAVRTQTYLIKK